MTESPAAHAAFLEEAIHLAQHNVSHGGRPFGAVLVRNGEVIARGVNEIAATADPTAHAELQAIREASRVLGSPRLEGCVVYASGQPCPMCLAAMYLSGISALYFAYSNAEGEPYGLSTAPIYAELGKPLADQRLFIQQLRVLPDSGLYETWERQRP